MKVTIIKLAALLAIAVSFTACVKEETPKTANETFVPMATDSLIYSGSFVDAPSHDASGTVEVYENNSSRTLSFKNFRGDNGPDLRVYLSTNSSASDFVELGNLTAVQGDFSYTVDASVDLDVYSTVLIWCEDFSVNFGTAALQKL